MYLVVVRSFSSKLEICMLSWTYSSGYVELPSRPTYKLASQERSQTKSLLVAGAGPTTQEKEEETWRRSRWAGRLAAGRLVWKMIELLINRKRTWPFYSIVQTCFVTLSKYMLRTPTLQHSKTLYQLSIINPNSTELEILEVSNMDVHDRTECSANSKPNVLSKGRIRNKKTFFGKCLAFEREASTGKDFVWEVWDWRVA